ncbi:MAG: glycosyltransferase family 2 protein [Gammaproteobacteria bacterium]|nr:glycosyltransferase family 2 protein [Gammaproteobacteria bacterium]
MFKPCVIIPVYNHPEKIKSVIDRISRDGFPTIIVDDGCLEPCKGIVAELAATEPNILLLRFDVNRGKGAAVCDGLRAALDQGYTHALQVDADGQHDLGDIRKFMDIAEQHPASVVTGVRIAKNAPRGRRLGRKLTDVWVWINTLSFSIKDSMCGYRLYPLSSTVALIDKVKICERMDFDTDILVRLCWENLDIRQIKTRVIYDDNISSHFDILNDNVRISRMHAKLFFGMLMRLPLLLMRWRRPAN